MTGRTFAVWVSLLFMSVLTGLGYEPPATLRPILFLGDNGHHRPMERFRQIEPILRARGFDLTYTDQLESLRPQLLAQFDGLIIYANHTAISPEQEKALLDFVEQGKGLIPLHCASYCFLNSPRYIELVGAQFLRHGTGTVRTLITEPGHPIMKDFQGFESWDETYVHHKHHAANRIVLEVREENGAKEPWTWVRTQGKGRVFYTAWGHDARTWGHPGFQHLLERGLRWALGDDPAKVPPYVDRPVMTELSKEAKPFQYVPANVPFYPPRGGGSRTDTQRQMPLPLDPAESQMHMVHPVDFELRLFVAEPSLGGKPIAMNWDEQGRLWVAVTVDYPNDLQPEGQGHDRIIICEDSTGDGQADKLTVFADRLSIPTSLLFARGGVIVHQAPHTLFLKDTNGDDVADERTVLFSGWHTGDTHAGPSNLRYGLDNWLWGIVGYSGFRGQVGSQRHAFSQGFYRFTPDGQHLEFLASTSNNSWGVGISEEGLIFGSTANGNPSVHLAIPNRYYEAVHGWTSKVLGSISGDVAMHPITDQIRQVDYHGRFTAAAGHALYTARQYPPYYWNRTAFVAEPTGHLVATFTLQPFGADFRSRNAWNLLASQDEWTAPTMAEVGPDGNVWVIDWYNYIVQHNPTPRGFETGKGNAYVTDLRDKKHGRIYRLVAKNKPAAAKINLKNASAKTLVQTLTNDNLFWRLHAQRLLVERQQADVVPSLIALIQDPKVDAIGLNPGAIHALWTLHGLGLMTESHPMVVQTVVQALKHPSAGVRRNAVMVLPRNLQGLHALLTQKCLKDGDAQVRLASLLALAEMPPDAEAARALVEVAQLPDTLSDRWLREAAICAAARQQHGFLAAICQTKRFPTELLEVLRIVAEHIARSEDRNQAAALLPALCTVPPVGAEAILQGFAKGWPEQHTLSLESDQENRLIELFHRLPPAGQSNLVKVAARWGSQSLTKQINAIVETFLKSLQDEKLPAEQRVSMAKQLVDLKPEDEAVLQAIMEHMGPRQPPALTTGLMQALGASRSPRLASLLIRESKSWTPQAKREAMQLLLQRSERIHELLTAVEKRELPWNDLAPDQIQTLLHHPDPKVAERAKPMFSSRGGVPNPDRQKIVEHFMPLIKKNGDPVKGKLVFMNHCAKCHTHGKEGNKVGPDLTGMAALGKEQLLTEILDPNRSVEGNYRQYTVVTEKGRLLTGLLASETRTAITLIDAEGKSHALLREEIDQLTASSKSLMPEGFEQQINETEMVDLLAFLSQRSRFIPLSLEKVATMNSTRGMFYSEQAEVERLIFRDWSTKVHDGVPFHLIDPRPEGSLNVVLFHGPQGQFPPHMPKQITLDCQTPVKTLHLLSGVSGWGYPASPKGTTSLLVRLHFQDGEKEEHALLNGEHFADYIRRVDVPQSSFAFSLRGQQIRHIQINPKRSEPLRQLEFVKGPDRTAPILMAVTVETPSAD